MMLFLIICLCAALISAIVLTLKTANDKRQKEIVDADQPLPSLAVDLNTLPGDSAHAPEPEPEPEPEPAPEPAPATAQNWKELARQYREAGDFAKAIAAADEAWPQWQHYEQVALTMRAAIRASRKLASPQTESWLKALHRAAAEASLLHDKGSDNKTASLAPTFEDRSFLANIELPWQEIGAEQLRLLTKTDRQQMTEAWGEPHRHISARQFIAANNTVKI